MSALQAPKLTGEPSARFGRPGSTGIAACARAESS